jgi:hypothetical protein
VTSKDCYYTYDNYPITHTNDYSFFTTTECRLASFRGAVSKLPNDLQSKIQRLLIEKDIEVDEAFEEELLRVALPTEENNKYPSTATSTLAHDEFDACLDAAIMSNPTLFP